MKMLCHISDGPQTPEDAAELWDTVFRRIEDPEYKLRLEHAMKDPKECPNCKEVSLYPEYYPMWQCSECFTEVQF